MHLTETEMHALVQRVKEGKPKSVHTEMKRVAKSKHINIYIFFLFKRATKTNAHCKLNASKAKTEI